MYMVLHGVIIKLTTGYRAIEKQQSGSVLRDHLPDHLLRRLLYLY